MTLTTCYFYQFYDIFYVFVSCVLRTALSYIPATWCWANADKDDEGRRYHADFHCMLHQIPARISTLSA